MTELSGLFEPSRVALVGATDREGSIGRGLMENLGSFEGEVVPVNPNQETVLGEKSYPTIDAVPGRVDLAVVAVPPDQVISVIRAVAEAAVRDVVVITAGFSERGEAGESRERQLVELAEAYDLNLVGPNSLGIMSTPVSMNATFAGQTATEGRISFFSQSGAFITAILDWAAHHDMGFRHVVSLGNEAALDEVDFLIEWGEDPDTDVILGYVEDIEDGRMFIEIAREVTSETPVVVIKSGRTTAGAKAAASHTGSLAGSDDAYDAAFEQSGVVRANTVQELVDFGQELASQPLPEADSVGVVSNAGGAAVLAADAIADSRLSLAEFDDETVAALEAILPSGASPRNPLDIIGDATLDRFHDALGVVLDSGAVDAAIVLACPTTIFDFDDLATTIGELAAKRDEPVAACLMGGQEAMIATERLDDFGIQNYFDPSRAVRSIETLANYRDVRQREYDPPTEFDVDRKRAGEILAEAKRRNTDRLGVEALELLDAYGIPTPASEIVDTPADAEAVAGSMGGSVVLKIVSPDIVHKSDVGGVRVGIDPEAVRTEFQDLIDDVRDRQPEATIRGVLVQEFVPADAGTEVIIGVKRDPQFGPLLMFGLGGIFVEVLGDVSFRVAPIGETEVRTMIDEVGSAPILYGARGREPADIDAVVETVQRVSQLVEDFPIIQELDVNPVVATPRGVSAIDLRLTVHSGQHRNR